MDTDKIILIIIGILGSVATLNEKVRNFITGKATFKKEVTDATDDTIERLMNRVNTLSDEFVNLSEENIKNQKENYEHRKMIDKLKSRCKHDCDS